MAVVVTSLRKKRILRHDAGKFDFYSNRVSPHMSHNALAPPHVSRVQGHLTYKKTHPLRTLP